MVIHGKVAHGYSRRVHLILNLILSSYLYNHVAIYVMKSPPQNMYICFKHVICEIALPSQAPFLVDKMDCAQYFQHLHYIDVIRLEENFSNSSWRTVAANQREG